MPEAHRDRYLAWDACYNIRDVGGYPTESGGQIRWRTLVRADNLNRLTDDGQAALLDYGLRTIIDLRLAEELETYPNPWAAREGVEGAPRYLHLPLHYAEDTEAIDAASPTQGDYIVILEKSRALVAMVIKAVAAALQEGGVLVHCHGGKDRTGIVVALLLSLAGVPRQTIAEDYALSETLLESANVAWLEEQSRIQGQPVERPLWMYSPPEKMRALLDYLDREYGGVEGYLEATGVTPAEMHQIRQALT